MTTLSQAVGARIRLYRQMKKLTLVALSEKIYKSKATLSKYETGEITVDVETLFDIAAALKIRPQQLLDIPCEDPAAPAGDGGSFFAGRRIYLYFYDGRSSRIVRNLLAAGRDGDPAGTTLYYDLPSFRKPEECRNLYVGTAEYFDTVSNFFLASQSNRIEHISLCAANPFDRLSQVLGMLSGLSRHPLLPVSIKCILSPDELEENDALKEKLLLSPQDARLIRSMNMFAIKPLE